MDLRSKISTILKDLPEAKNSTFKENYTASFINNGLNDVLNADFLPKNYETHGSAGMGKWATIPWIGIFDKDINTSPREGFDIVYLFSANYNHVYLSLNQGWTYYKNSYGLKDAKNNIQQVSKYLLSRLYITSPRMTTSPIDLLGNKKITSTSLPRGYELSNIVSINYDKNNLPSNQTMLADLHDMVGLLNQIKDQLIFPNLERNIENFISSSDDYTMANLEENPDQSFEINDSASVGNDKLTGRKTDFNLLNTKNSETGISGEKLVLKFEQKKLSEYPHLLAKIKHVSQEEGDGTGYDIKSYKIDGSELYIEVKTTTGNENTPFYITSNELKASEIYDNYVIFRIYNYRDNTPNDKFDYFTITDSLKNNPIIDLEASEFKVKINKNNIINSNYK